MDLPPRPASHLSLWEQEAIEGTVRRFLKGTMRLGMHQPEDLEQELVVHWFQNRPRFAVDGTANERTWMVRLLENKLRDLAREERAKKRSPASGVVHSLDQEFEAFGEGLNHQQALHSLGDVERDVMRAELRRQTYSWFAGLPEADRETVSAIYQSATSMEAAKRLGIRRPSLYDRLKKLRRLAGDARLNEFL